MMIHGFGFLSLSASLVLPWALTGLVQGQRITDSLVKDVRQLSTVQEMSLASPNLTSPNLTSPNLTSPNLTSPNLTSPNLTSPNLTSPNLSSQVSTATTYYVSGIGNDKNRGLSTSSPFRTIQRAADLTNPGDTVLIMDGVYKNASPVGTVIDIKRSGTANAWIRYKAYPGDKPKLQHNGWNGILIHNGASYIEVNGLEIVGNNGNITRAYALREKKNKLNPLTNGNCVTIDGENNRRSHHIRILNNKIHDCGGGGISAMESDYLTVDNNKVFNNAWYSVYGASGISLLNNWNSDNGNSQKYKNFVTRNEVYNNQMLVPWIQNNKYQDGNGIIIDRSRNNMPGSTLSGYQGRTLIGDNVSYKNGGSGIHTYESEHVDIINNTTYLNNQTAGIEYGQIMSNHSGDIHVLNNILYSAPNRPINLNNQSTNVTFNYNLYNNNGYSANAVGPNDIMADPQFMNASKGDFRLKRTSRAINSAYESNYVSNYLTTDFLGNPRVHASTLDRGAYEMQY